jgi:hypothetical protein
MINYFSFENLFPNFVVGLILWHIDLFLGNDRRTNNDTTAIARQQLRKYATVLDLLLGSGLRPTMEVLSEAMFSKDPLRRCITRQTELR